MIDSGSLPLNRVLRKKVELEQTDQEQVEALQKWWGENWLSLLGGLVIGLGGILGWQYYGEHRADQAMSASSQFEAIKTQLVTEKLTEAAAGIAALEQAHADSPYVAQAHLAMAQAQAESGNWAAAASALEQVLIASDDPALLGLARLRLARAQWAQGDVTGARASLNADSVAAAYAPLYAELDGDIAYEQGDMDAARAAWDKALATQSQALDRGSIQRKLDMLP